MSRRQKDIFASSRPRRNPILIILIIVFILAAFILTAAFFNKALNRNVTLINEKVSVLTMNKAYEGFSVLFLSDLHASEIGSNTEIWTKLLSKKTFHAVVLGGDMVGSKGDYEPLLSLIHILKKLQPDAPVYFIAGDDDPDPIASDGAATQVYSEWVVAACKAGGTYLDVPTAQVFKKRNVWFVPEYLYDIDTATMARTLENQKTAMEEAGMQYTVEKAGAYRILCSRLDAMQRSAEAIQQIEKEDLQIAVNHTPLDAGYIRESLEYTGRTDIFSLRGVSLMLCGHLCGGQWCLPGGQPLYIPEWGMLPNKSEIAGMQRLNSLNIYISGGLGASEQHPLPGRMFNRPQAALIKLTKNVQ